MITGPQPGAGKTQAGTEDPKKPDAVPTEEMVCMRMTLPRHVDMHGTRLEDIAGTGEEEGFGG